MELQTLNKKIILGLLVLSVRTLILTALSYITINLILARILSPAIIGVFDIANSVLAFTTFFSDIGLAGAIIQKRELKQADLKTVFTIQEILIFTIFIVVWFASPALSNWYRLDNSGTFLIRSLSLGFLIGSFKIIPSLILERNLEFSKKVLIAIVEAIVFNGALIYLAFNGWSLDSFSYSTLLQAIAGVAITYTIAPWRISFGLSKESLKELLHFGVPFQLNSFLALLKDRLVPLVIARMIGATGVGYVAWASSLAFFPIDILGSVIQVLFPAFSRLQDNKPALKNALERALFLVSLLLYPLLFGILAVAPSIIKYIVRHDWQPALPLIYLFAINTLWASISTTFTNFLDATGRVKTHFKLMLMWTSLTWILTPILTYYYGFIGVALASSIIAFTSIIPIIIVKRIINPDILGNIWQPLMASVIMGVATYFFAAFFVKDILSLIITIALGGAIYLLIMFILARRKVLSALHFNKELL